MVIKKHKNHNTQKTNTHTRLEAYARQGRSYRKTNRGIPNRTVLKGSLAAIIPLAAAGALQAQTGCQGPANGGATMTLNFMTAAIDSTVITVGGQNMTFDAYMVGSIYRVKAKGANLEFFGYGFGINSIRNLPSAVTVTRSFTYGGGPAAFQSDGVGCFNSVPFFFSFCAFAGSFVAIKQTNTSPHRPGWMKIDVVTFNTSQFKFKVVERGVEDPNNTPNNSAVTGDCASMASSLPVEMTHFRATPQDKHIQLEWATASELNNEGFEVQRSTDGRSFAKVGWVNGNGTTNEEQTYRFLDDEVQPNTKYYYRLQQMDTDGTSEFSPVRSAMVEDASLVQVSEFFPNPVGKGRAVARFKLNMPEDGQMDIQVFDARGGLVKELKREYTAGRNTLGVPIRDLSAGQYFVKMQLGQEVLYRKLLVK